MFNDTVIKLIIGIQFIQKLGGGGGVEGVLK